MLRKLPLEWKFILATLSIATVAGIITYFNFPKFTGLVMLFFYIIPSNSFIPFPHEPAIIYYGKIFGPMTTAITATVPTIIACVIDYAVLGPAFSRTRLRKIKETRVYQKTVYYYHKAPFFTNFVAALSPVPFYPVRILSVSSDYPMWKYTTAVVLGRAPRYYFLAFFGAILNIPNWVIGFFFLSLVSGALYGKISHRRKKLSLQSIEHTVMDSDDTVEIIPEEPLSMETEEIASGVLR